MFMMRHFPTQSFPILADALDDSNEDVRWQAASQSEYWGSQAIEAVPALERRLDDESPDVRKIVKRAIETIDPDRIRQLKQIRKLE